MKRRHSAGQHATYASFVVSDVMSSVPKHLLTVTSNLIFGYPRGSIHLLLKDMRYLYAVASTLLHLFMGGQQKKRVNGCGLVWYLGVKGLFMSIIKIKKKKALCSSIFLANLEFDDASF